ncbi:hypothetical protein N7509_003468 [Penicillium cosmopolitanum]|uniref:Calponin-homology (CH) domain-containing protein n=1 Tax=Penicillium cosmopolitanum TaxID=1131564 RepID=A0A9W9W5A3_9EURO|nr:uncharacterized protein N7509_003468 [Penicillium cosmopolitanum]KAJ5403597.1 hypothetical protein N7509_003468 [Penicillium cosmopolitanum]
MSGLLGEAFTPCPSRSRSSCGGSETFDSFMDGDLAFEATTQLEYTTEIRAPILTGARPRRANRTGPTFQIHDDVMNRPAGPAEKRRRPNTLANSPSGRKSSLLAQPAQRFRPKVNFAPSPPSRPNKIEMEAQPKTQRHETETNDEAVAHSKEIRHTDNKHRHDHKDALKRDVRRNTVYIPPDDTTVASVFMGLFSPLKKQQTTTLSKMTEDAQVNTLEAQIAKRQARKSMVTSARRAPLQPSTKIAQEAAIRVDIAGKNGGKENIPPGALAEIEKKHTLQSTSSLKPKRASIVSTSKSTQHNIDQRARPAKATQPSTKVPKQNAPARGVLGERQNNTLMSRSPSAREKHSLTRSKETMKSPLPLNFHASTTSSRVDHSRSLRSSNLGHISTKLKNLNQEYPMLVENTAKPALYEDNWLHHQETVITQLVNSLLECTNGDSTPCGPNALRLEMLEIYHTDFFAQLHKRLQASLSCGTLSIPKELVTRYGRLKQDVGLRRKFLDIWVQSYDLRALVAAAETVIGRKISNNPTFLERDFDGPDENAMKGRKVIIRKLEGFLDSFLLHNDDMDHMVSDSRDIPMEAQARAYRRTVLRSIILVVILDQAKQSRGTSLPRRLFVQSSPFKSSVEVLQALARVLLPSCGDMSKPLGHLGCHLTYKQHKLQEYNYQINNIAVDLRDGVRLTRIVEVLFFTSEHVRSDVEDQTEVTLHTGEALSLLGDEADLPLSKHLKYPCASRAAKIYNVQMALSALGSIKGSDLFLDDIRAEDIVDGYREKTIALFWALVSKWGLAGLVDWEDASKEIARLKRKAVSLFGYDKCVSESWFSGDELDGDEHARMLQQWASILAALKGLSITNMTTGFANGKVYESIVDEYERYITGSTCRSTMTATPHPLSLESRLKLLGCSSQFAQLVSPKRSTSHILDRNFTLGALAFLCSRLLSASKHSRAATILQRAWRAHLGRRDTQRRAIAQDLAAHCAAVVKTKSEIIRATEVITRWWRDIKARQQRKNTTGHQRQRKLVSPSCKTAKRRL